MSGHLRFRRRIRLAPGLSLNLNKSSASISAGVRGAHLTFGPRGRRASIGLPGSGLSYIDYQRYGAQRRPGSGIGLVGHFVIGVVIALVGLGLLALIGSMNGG